MTCIFCFLLLFLVDVSYMVCLSETAKHGVILSVVFLLKEWLSVANGTTKPLHSHTSHFFLLYVKGVDCLPAVVSFFASWFLLSPYLNLLSLRISYRKKTYGWGKGRDFADGVNFQLFCFAASSRYLSIERASELASFWEEEYFLTDIPPVWKEGGEGGRVLFPGLLSSATLTGSGGQMARASLHAGVGIYMSFWQGNISNVDFILFTKRLTHPFVCSCCLYNGYVV